MKHAIKILEGSFAAIEATNKSGLFPADHEIPVDQIRHSIRKALILLKRYEKKSPSAKNSLEALIVEAEAIIGRLEEIQQRKRGLAEKEQAQAGVGQEERVAGQIRGPEEAARALPDVPRLRVVDPHGNERDVAPPLGEEDAGGNAGNHPGV